MALARCWPKRPTSVVLKSDPDAGSVEGKSCWVTDPASFSTVVMRSGSEGGGEIRDEGSLKRR